MAEASHAHTGRTKPPSSKKYRNVEPTPFPFSQVTPISFIQQQRFVTTGKEMPTQAMPPIEAHGVSAQKPLHPRHQIRPRRFHHQVEMIPHKAIGVHLPVRFPAYLPEQLQKS